MNIALLAVLLGAEPGDVISADRIDTLRSTLDAAEANWRTHAPASYRYQLTSGGPFGATMHAISVTGGECKAKMRTKFGRKVSAWKPASCDGYSIADILAELRRQLSLPQERIELAFDATYGFPTIASFEPHSEIHDQSEYFEIKAFRARERGRGP